MTTSQTAFLSDITDASKVVPAGTRAYLQERLRNRLYDLVLTEFMKRQRENPEFTQAALAKRIERGGDQVNRWLRSPGNWTIDTISDLLVGIAGAELTIGVSGFADRPSRNYIQPEWLSPEPIARGCNVFSLLPYNTAVYNISPKSSVTYSVGEMP